MKKIIAIIFAAVIGFGVASAQYGSQNGSRIGVGASLLYGTKINTVGVGLKVQYTVTDVWRTELGYNYLIGNHEHMWEGNLNAHYLLGVGGSLRFYPMAGLNISSYSYKNDVKTTKFGVNLGAGFDYSLTDNVSVNVEGKYVASGLEHAVFGLGLTYTF